MVQRLIFDEFADMVYCTIINRIKTLVSSPIRRRLLNGAFWGGVGSVVSRGAVLLSSYFLARFLGQAQFGEYGIVNSTSAMLSAVAGLGVGATATKYVAELKNSDKRRAGRIISLSSMITWVSGSIYGLVFVVLAKWLSETTLAAPHLNTALQISAISVALGVINGSQQSALSGFESFKTLAWINSSCGLLQSALTCFGAYMWGLNGSIAGIAFAMIITVSITRQALGVQMKSVGINNWWREAWSEWPVLLNFSLPSFLTSILFGPVVWICNAMLANQPNGYAELGIYNAANQWYSFVLFIPGILSTAVLPVMAERIGANDAGANKRIMMMLTKMTFVFVFPVVLVLSLMRSLIMGGYGTAFCGGGEVFVAAVVTGAVQAMTAPAWYVIVASGRMWRCFLISLLQGVLWVGIFWALLKSGAEGLAYSRLIAVIVTAIIVALSVGGKSAQFAFAQRCHGA